MKKLSIKERQQLWLEEQRERHLRSERRAPAIAFGIDRPDVGEYTLREAAWRDSCRIMRRKDVGDAFYSEFREE